MLPSLSKKSSSATSSTTASPATINLNVSPESLMEGSPVTSSSTQPSPTNNFTMLYSIIVHSDSYNEVLSKIHILDPNSNHHRCDLNQVQVQIEEKHEDEDSQQQLLSQILQPNRKCVEEALSHARPNIVTQLLSTSFDHTEKATNLCLLLLQSIYHAHALYSPFHELVDTFPIDHRSISQLHCNIASEAFVQFDRGCVTNPFDSFNFDEINSCFSDLKQQLDHNLQKSHSRIRLINRATIGFAIFLIGTTVAVTIAAVAVSVHAFAAIVAAVFCTAYFPSGLTKKELAHVSQLDAARKGTYVINKFLDTLERLVARLYTAIEGDKQLVKLGLGRDRDKHSIQEVVKQIRNSQLNFTNQLKDLKEHLCLCFKTVNWARSLLLEEIHLQQTSNP